MVRVLWLLVPRGGARVSACVRVVCWNCYLLLLLLLLQLLAWQGEALQGCNNSAP
jgi:hypothetical protein